MKKQKLRSSAESSWSSDDMDIVIDAIAKAQGYIITGTILGACIVEKVKPDSTLLKQALKRPQQATIIKAMVKHGLKLPVL